MERATRGPAPPVLIAEEAIRARVGELARRISGDFAGRDDLVIVGVLKGAFVFLADLARRIQVPHAVEFVILSRYGADAAGGPEVTLLQDARTDLGGRPVLIVEDIVDTGHTLRYLAEHLGRRGPAPLRTCALLSKPARREAEVPIDYLGFEIPDVWVVGYGLDAGERWRSLPYVGVAPTGHGAAGGEA